MGFYQRWILPRVLDVSMRREDLNDYRKEIVGRAHGRVLEIGIGSGLNLPFYNSAVEELVGIDPSPELLKMAKERGAKCPARVELLEGSSEELPMESKSVDSIVMTWV